MHRYVSFSRKLYGVQIYILSLEFVLLSFYTAGSGMGAAAVFERGDAVDDLCNARVHNNNNFLSKDAK